MKECYAFLLPSILQVCYIYYIIVTFLEMGVDKNDKKAHNIIVLR